MSDLTDILGLPLIAAGQAQKHVTHNEALTALDAVVQISVLGRSLTAPPPAPASGDRYIPAGPATGAWAGQENAIAVFRDGAWAFYPPREGWLCWIADEDALAGWDGVAWAGAGGPNAAFETLGVNGAAADATNRIAVNAAATLLNHAGNGHQLKLNKNAAGDTASVLFQTNWSGRAEFGLTGDDDWHVKVSADGVTWREAFVVDRTDGSVSFPNGSDSFRQRLSADRTYYVRADGNDANDGLSDTTGGAFLTVQKAVNVALALDMDIFSVTISVGAGSFAEGGGLLVKGNGNARITIQGSGYAATFISGTSSGIQARGGVELTLRDFDLGTAGAVCLWARYGAQVFLRGSIAFSGGSARLIGSDHAAYIEALACSIYLASNSTYFLFGAGNGEIYLGSGVTVFSTAPRTFTATVFASTTGTVTVIASQVTWNEAAGAIAGKRYDVQTNGVINTAGGGASYLPGTAAGTAATGGQYV